MRVCRRLSGWVSPAALWVPAAGWGVVRDTEELEGPLGTPLGLTKCNMLFRLVIAFLPRSKCLLISWLLSPSAVILELKKIKSDRKSVV